MVTEFDASLPEYVRSNADYKAAKVFKEIVRPKDGVDYDWVCDYAVEQYGREMSSWNSLEDKANDILKYIGTGAGALAIISAIGVKPETTHLVIAALPAILVAWWSVLTAAYARRPTERLFPPAIEVAFHYASAYGKEARIRYVGQWHYVCEALTVERKKKAQLVERATRLYVIALALLVLPVVLAIFMPPKVDTAKSKVEQSVSQPNSGA